MKTEILVISIIGTLAIGGLIGIFTMLFIGRAIPGEVVGIVVGAVGTLGSMLVHISRPGSEPPQNVQVVNKPTDPVPTDPQ